MHLGNSGHQRPTVHPVSNSLDEVLNEDGVSTQAYTQGGLCKASMKEMMARNQYVQRSARINYGKEKLGAERPSGKNPGTV